MQNNATTKQQAAQADLLRVDPSWNCSLHGTVTACPFVWMNCFDFGDTMPPKLDEQTRRKVNALLAAESVT